VPGLAVEHTQLLKAKATFALRNTVVENVVAIQPALEAVHNANASPIERYLPASTLGHPYVFFIKKIGSH